MSASPGETAASSPFSPDEEERIARVRGAMLRQIAVHSSPQHTTIRNGPEGWQQFIAGLSFKPLRKDGGTLTYLLRIAPGAVVPAHRHAADEECLVLEGDLHMEGALVLRAGDYHLARAGVLHAPIRSESGALLFLRGAEPQVSDFL